MSDKVPVDENDVIDLRSRWEQPEPARGRSTSGGLSSDTRRRALLLGLPALIILVTVLLLITLGGGGGDAGDDEARLEGAATGSKTRQTSQPIPNPDSTVGPAEPGTPTSASTPTTGGDVAPPLSLPPADPKLPPQEAIGYFRDGKLYLEGSVPDLESAAGYLAKATDVLGADNVFVDMKLDSRAPAGPARVIVEERFQFPTGSDAVDPKYDTLLGIGVFALEKIPEATLVITGYTDDVGDAEENRVLSQRRAQAVVDYMVANGIPADRVIAIGRGEANPIADNTTPEGRETNRRIEGSLEGIMPN